MDFDILINFLIYTIPLKIKKMFSYLNLFNQEKEKVMLLSNNFFFAEPTTRQHQTKVSDRPNYYPQRNTNFKSKSTRSICFDFQLEQWRGCRWSAVTVESYWSPFRKLKTTPSSPLIPTSLSPRRLFSISFAPLAANLADPKRCLIEFYLDFNYNMDLSSLY